MAATSGVPGVSVQDMRRFHDEHFSGPSMTAFERQFFSKAGEEPQPVYGQEQALDGQEQTVEYDYEEEVEEDLGYYEDGTPRTLTDEQIRMFRQSELREMLRHWEKRKAIAAKAGIPAVFSVRDPKHDASLTQTKRSREDDEDEDESEADEDGEASESATNATGKSRKRNKKKKKNKKKNGNTGQRKEPKPDLRKRTWDVVDTGLDSLEYD